MGRSQIKKGTATVKESRVLNEDKAKISEVLIPLLPQLLHRVGASFFLFVVVRVPSYSLVSFCLKKQLLMLHMFFFFQVFVCSTMYQVFYSPIRRVRYCAWSLRGASLYILL